MTHVFPFGPESQSLDSRGITFRQLAALVVLHGFLTGDVQAMPRGNSMLVKESVELADKLEAELRDRVQRQ